MVAKFGKGYGEGEIMKYIIDNSKLLSPFDSFYKVTGRLYIDNFSDIYKEHVADARVFDNPITPIRRLAKRVILKVNPRSRHSKGRVGTVFYKCDLCFFVDKLRKRSQLVNDYQVGETLEHTYFSPLINAGFSNFRIQPKIIGYSGTTGRHYKNGDDYPYDIQRYGACLANKLRNRL